MIRGEVCFIIPVWCIMCCLLKWDLSFQWKNIYYLFVCCGVGTFQGKLRVSVGGGEFLTPIFLSPFCISEQHDPKIGIKKKNHLEYPNSQPSEEEVALLGFPNNICKANGIVAVKHLLQRKWKEQKGRDFTCVWEQLWIEQIHPKGCAKKNAARIRDSTKRGHAGSLMMDFLALTNSVGI